MTSDDVDRIEARLGVTLPTEYRDLITNYPADLGDAAQYDLVDRAEFVIEETRKAQFAELSVEARWPSDYVIIGHSGCGDYYCLDLGQKPSPVMCWNHDSSEFEYEASSVTAWVKKIARRKGNS